jgi:hypothetical protein
MQVYTSMWDMCSKEYRLLGPRAFFQGLVPTVLAVSPQVAVTVRKLPSNIVLWLPLL